MVVQDIIDKRKRIWNEKHDIQLDAKLVEASAVKILSTPELAQEIIAKPYLLIECAFTIVNKKQQTVPFFLNAVQRDFIAKLEQYGTSKPYYVLKGRQQGFTTLITAIQLSYAIVSKNFAGFTIADKGSNTQTIFNDKARTVYGRLPEQLRPTEKFNSVNELFFDKLNSSWRIATASPQVGRSRTLNFIHFSEIATYECLLSDLQAGIGRAATADALIIYETTANGFNQAKDLWDSESCINLFYEWWQTEEYRSTESHYIDTADAWLEERIVFLRLKGCDEQQIAWYCKTYAGLIDKQLIKQEYPCTPEEAFISSGNSLFQVEAINAHIQRISTLPNGIKGVFEYKKQGAPITDSQGIVRDMQWTLTQIEFKERADGYITIHTEPKVESKDGVVVSKCPYVIGGDTAGTGEDYFTAKVIDNTSGATVATLRVQRIDEDIYAEQVLCLAKHYNDALIALEINYSRHPLRVIQGYGYTKLYMRERVDAIADKTIMDYGFETTRKTKPIIIAELVELMRTNIELECDVNTLKEMLTFVKKSNGSMEAIDGAHDDLVMALAIAHFASTQQTNKWIDCKPEETDFIQKFFGHKQNEQRFMNWEEF